MKSMKRIVKEMSDRVDYLANDGREWYAASNERLEKWFAGADSFPYYYGPKDNPEQFSGSYDIVDVFEVKADEFAIAAAEFAERHTLETFAALLDAYYIGILADMAGHLSGKKQAGALDVDLSMESLLSLAFFGVDEQRMMMLRLKARLDEKRAEAEQKDKPELKRCYGWDSILPLSILLHNDFSAGGVVIDNLAGLLDAKKTELRENPSDNFNDIYRAGYEILSKDGENLSKDGDIFADAICRMCEFHLENCRTNSQKIFVFDSAQWQFFPVEILCLIKLSGRRDAALFSHPLIAPYRDFIGFDGMALLSDVSRKMRDTLFSRFAYRAL